MMRRGFSLIELLVVIAIIAVLLAILVPALSSVRSTARTVMCLSNLRQLGVAWSVYADDFQSYAMPAADAPPAGHESDTVYWFGAVGNISGTVEAERGFLAPYLEATLHDLSVFECPNQPWGTYAAQTAPGTITTTYGYNGYYLSPSKTPGWSMQIGHRPWRRTWEIRQPAELLIFADTLLPGSPPRNSALLDPPMLYQARRGWVTNSFPTTAFRHAGAVATLSADVSGKVEQGDKEQMTHGIIGSLDMRRYVPDWMNW
ncbi:MAG: prepilin-type N-terminal cleavage/methylation domain-containing protein [Phycisphaeraceae bacterium]|nr:prepilin-type N-terminal cleavage/methylation domain-containing protein [Phycisphaeraceae bacterium]MCW5762718.1 prepilin-type N-terminal cleavage/methylation domain-containing protein [Phycisphaeraceae bacterium]